MILNIIAGVLSGILGAMGFGGGGILILYLTMFRNLPQLNAQGINLIFFIPSAVLALVLHTKNKLIDWKTAFKYIGYGLVGVILGFIFLKFIEENTVRKIFSVILILMGLKELFSKNKN
ncbi:MAG: sulfite exporter TauE/SafE family protein [Clostridia bacterium]|nr:sulfite exporter TauE/SafE family protein [Clostridia bacterium]